MNARGFAQRSAAQTSQSRSCRRPPISALVITVALLELIAATAHGADLTSAVIRGSSVYSAPELFEVYRTQLGKPISREGARAIVAELIAKYESDGYSRPQVRLDDALVEHGILRIDVSEARISEVKISGDPGPHLARLETLGLQLRAAGPIRQEDMQATLRQMRQLPGLTLSATTARDEALANAYRLDVDTLFDPVTGAVRVTNRGTEEAGPNFVLGQVVANGLLGGRTSLGALFGAATDYDEYHGVGVLANVGFGERGGRISLNGFSSRSNPQEPVVDRDDLYVRDRLTARMTRPLMPLSRWGGAVFVGVDLDDLAISRSQTGLRDERLRMLETGTAWNWRGGSTTQYAGSVELVKGLDAFGSGITALDLANDPRRADFTLLRINFARATRLSERWSIRLDAFAQQSAYVLPYNERFKIGGDRLGRGFEVAEIAGDHGIGAKVEARRYLTNAPPLLGRTSIYGFYDVGATWKQDVPGRESAATTGIGFATQGRRTTGTLELAQPLTHGDVEGSRDVALFAELAVSF